MTRLHALLLIITLLASGCTTSTHLLMPTHSDSTTPAGLSITYIEE